MNRFFIVVYTLFRPLQRLLFPVEVTGLERLPHNATLLCPNHRSAWDPILLVLTLPRDYRLHIMAKMQLMENPILSWILQKLGVFGVNRGSTDLTAIKTAINSIKCGDNLLIFPEGTRVDYEGEVRPKGGVAMIGLRTGAQFVPVYIEKRKIFRRSKIVFGEAYLPTILSRHGTSEELQQIADELLKRAYDLGREA